ncbi:MAG TPA: hypothetical protein VHG51_20185 [Longimicrobiaceae bacterium]|nr:hypothetical protein [Longimicrobiaceae bacterium]
MKILRLALGALLLVAACESPDPITPPPAPRHDADGGAGVPCDSACEATRNPSMGGSHG